MRVLRVFLRRAVVTAIQISLIATMLTTGVLVEPLPARAAGVCSPGAGKDGAAGTLNAARAYNSYYQPPIGTIAAGTTSINIGTQDTGGGGALTAIGTNDLLLIIQMQDGTINSSNSSSYGDGATGAGYTSLGKAGSYEYVYVASIVGSTATIVGGAGGGLLNSYTEATATAGHGQETYQIIRVPQYTTATLSSTFHAAYWDGQTGGVAALDLASTLDLNGQSIYATGNGFRGGGLTVVGSTPAAILNNDWAASATMNSGAGTPPGHGSKGEGIAGTPDYIFEYTNFGTPSTPSAPTVINGSADGYPGGDQGRGAPANAGGGGTDEDPAANDQNSGGGGGGNGGTGGVGGFPWTPQYNTNTPKFSNTGLHTAAGYSTANTADIGGRGGVAISPSVTRVFMGGGGGAGANNNGSNDNTANNYGSSGGVGGGIVMMRLSDVSGAPATVYANGTTGLAPSNDGGGGGGAGGTIEISSPNTFYGITAHADGAAGTTAARTLSYPATQHGPGGGGGGGMVLTTSAVTATVTGAANGTTTPSATSYGATSGTSGTAQTISNSQIPGVKSGAECYSGNSSGLVTTGPVGGNATSGSYDGAVATTNNNDFTAWGLIPAGATLTNTGTTPGSPIGNIISQGPTTVNVPNEFDFNNTANSTQLLTITVTAPTFPAGWTAQICSDAAGAPNCTNNGSWIIGAPGSQSSSTYSVPRRTDSGAVKYWAVYSAPANLVAFTRYDATIYASDAGAANSNWTHNELYPGFIPLTKSQTVVSSGCPAGETPTFSSGICPGGVMLYTIDYRNVVVGAASESALTSAWPSTAAGQFTITENGAASGNTWGANSNGLKEALVAAANGTTTFGDSTAGSTFTGNIVGSTSFTDTPGGASGRIEPSGGAIAGAVSQGTLWFRVTIK